MQKRTWLIAALTAASVAVMASPAAAWGARSQAYGYGVTVGTRTYTWAGDWGWGGWGGYNYAAAYNGGGCTRGAPGAGYSYGWGYPNYGWSGYAYQPFWDCG
jgi:hypothetical protein